MEKYSARDEAVAGWKQDCMTQAIQNRREYLQAEIAKKENSLLGRVFKPDTSALKSAVTAAERVYPYIASQEYGDVLKAREPWRLDESSLANGTNLYIGAAKGYASQDFLRWTNDIAQQYTTTQDAIVAGVIESLRKIQWETVKIMSERGVATNPTLPHILLAGNPAVDIRIFQMAMKRAKKKKDASGLYSKRVAKRNLGPRESVRIAREERFAISIGSQGLHTLGGSDENVVVIDSSTVVQAVSNQSNSRRDIDTLINVVAEEEVHHQKYKDKEINEARERLSRRYGTILFIPYVTSVLTATVEEEVGLKAFVEEVLHELPSQNELMTPLWDRAPGYRLQK